MPDYVICARNVSGTRFGSEPAASTYLFVPEDGQPRPGAPQKQTPQKWATRVMAEARQGVPPGGYGNILAFVHGYNNSQATVMQRHRRLKADLLAADFKGVVISFDWPSGDLGLFYLEDLVDANRSAYRLVGDGIMLLAKFQIPECKVNVHLLAHSMGAYVVREAFTAADDSDDLTGQTWRLSQVMLIAPDISSRSLSAGDHRTDGLYRNCTRLTCYSNRHDDVLGLSNVKRAGVAPRAGRIGLPDTAPAHAINVDCTDYWPSIPSSQKKIGNASHSWHIGDPVFTRDMIDTMNGVERDVMTTRLQLAENRFRLVRPTT